MTTATKRPTIHTMDGKRITIGMAVYDATQNKVPGRVVTDYGDEYSGTWVELDEGYRVPAHALAADRQVAKSSRLLSLRGQLMFEAQKVARVVADITATENSP